MSERLFDPSDPPLDPAAPAWPERPAVGTPGRRGPQPFDLAGPLPTGRTLLEASAGTGKTYTIAGLVARYVAEGGRSLRDLLVVTFTRAATAELRERVRNRLVECADHLERTSDGRPEPTGDAVLDVLVAADPPERRRRLGRLGDAITDFDAATIDTIHGFCDHVLRTLGIAGDVDRDADFIEDQSDLVESVVDDLLVRRFHVGGEPPLKRWVLLEIARRVLANPDAAVVPAPGEAEGEAAVRAELARALREQLARRKRQARLVSFDDLLTRLADSLSDEERGPAACAAVRDRYRIALIDEFQDTDPVQWRILDRAFGDRDTTLVLIGDPKQAIYAFRGADVYAYLDAVHGSRSATRDDAGGDAYRAPHLATLATNWRSDARLLAAYDVLLAGATFGDRDIPYRSVRAAPGRDQPRLVGAPVDAPVRVRVVRRDHGLRSYQGDLTAPAAREHVAADVAAESVRLLSSGAQLIKRDQEGRAFDDGPLRPRDIAVLVRTNREGAQVQRALQDVDVPAIINGVGSVLSTPAATIWRRLLEALERPTSPGLARAVALTPFIGWTAQQVADADDDEMTPVHDLLHGWSATLRDHGVASLLRTISIATDLPGRLLARPNGERELTDIEHVGELLHGVATAEQLGTSALNGWLRARIAETEEDAVAPDERARRLESDSEAVQILTIHRAKGLEYPVVLAPFLWSAGRTWDDVPVFHGPDGRRTIDAGGKQHEAYEEHHELAMEERWGEDLRLLYVALTRARHQTIVWWAPTKNGGRSSLGRVLFGDRGEDGSVDTSRPAIVLSDDRCLAQLRTLEQRADGGIVVETTPPRPSDARWVAPPVEAVALATAPFERTIDRAWYRTSYSRLTARDDAPMVGSEGGEATKDDEALAAVAVTATTDGPGAGARADGGEAALRRIALPLSDMPSGTTVGTLVHEVLEHTDFAAADLTVELGRVYDERVAPRRVDLGDRTLFVDGLEAALSTPLGPLADDLRLRDVARMDRLDELDFEFPVDPACTGAAKVAAIGELLERHLPDDDPLADYGRRLREPGFHADVRGYLAGSIDLVLRVPRAGRLRYVVVDHKTNRLGRWDEAVTAWHYRPGALVEAMEHGHYPLQAILYSVALHRYLRWRLPDYDPDHHLGGVLYLFLRGMAGSHTPAGCGVFSWEPPAALVTAVSDLLHGEAA